MRNVDSNEDDENTLKDDLINISIKKIVSDSKLKYQSSIKDNAPSTTAKPSLNKLLRAKYNKYQLLIDDKAFLEHEINLFDSKKHKMPIGFVQTSGFTLTNGKCSANAFVLTKSIIEMIKLKLFSKQSKCKLYDPSLVTYRSPSSDCLRKAKIVHFYI